jgi:hypothetical protein
MPIDINIPNEGLKDFTKKKYKNLTEKELIEQINES